MFFTITAAQYAGAENAVLVIERGFLSGCAPSPPPKRDYACAPRSLSLIRMTAPPGGMVKNTVPPGGAHDCKL